MNHSRPTHTQALFETPAPVPRTLYFSDDGATPNSDYPVLVYRARASAGLDLASALEALIAINGWLAQWRGGVFAFHHYHARAHECLAVFAGRATLKLGGDHGHMVDVAPGDVLMLPAGTGHCRVTASHDFALIGAYPPDQQDWDLCRSDRAADYREARARIRAVSAPAQDPVRGSDIPPEAGGFYARSSA